MWVHFINLHIFCPVRQDKMSTAQQNELTFTILYFGKEIYLCLPIQNTVEIKMSDLGFFGKKEGIL